MKSIIYIITVFILFSLVSGFYLLRNKEGDVRPALLPVTTRQANTNSTPLTPVSGYTISYFAQNLGGVRDLEFSPGGTLLASATSAGTVVALPSQDGNTEVKELLTNLNNPHGLAFYNNQLFVAEERRIVRYNWDEKNLTATENKVLFALPPRGNHFTRSLVFDKSGKLYVSVGSTCNVCYEKDEKYSAVLISDSEGNNPRVFAKGLRNAVFLVLNPNTGEVWVTEMGRDFLGDNLPPDEVNILRSGKDYGWPNCYGDKVPDKSFNPSAECSSTESPIFQIPAHSAPLGLTFDSQGDLLVAYHGSWNRSVPDGYKVVKMKVSGNTITESEDFITGFIQDSEAIGRPVDLIFDKEGNLYISDDKVGAIYILTKP